MNLMVGRMPTVASSLPGSTTASTDIFAALATFLPPTDSATPQSPGEYRGRCEYLSAKENSNSSRQCEWIEAPRMRRSPAAFRVRFERRDTVEVAKLSVSFDMATSENRKAGSLSGG